jgi:ergothioneine biosynthesis protein EgtB
MALSIQEQLQETWKRSDEIFSLIDPADQYEQPISLRHPVIFYLGHLPAFAWNQVCRGLLGKPPFRAEFDELFERGIDPMGVDSYDSGAEWPPVSEVLEYRDHVRQELLAAIEPVAERAGRHFLAARNRIFAVAIEHELMHQETLQYMFLRFELEKKQRPEGVAPYRVDGAAPNGIVEVAGGSVVLGADFEGIDFGWDNEFPVHGAEVADFRIDRTPVRSAEYLEFVQSDGYRRPELWTDADWEWRMRTGVDHPACWSVENGGWSYHTMFDRLPLERVADWPVYTSRAEATAYCRWKGGRLPTESEFHRAAYSTPGGDLRRFPWGNEAPRTEHGNFDFRHWAPTPVGAHRAGDSAWGVAELVGNGWEWTDTVFEPYPGFEAYIPSYSGYSVDFFDGSHFVMLGASWATPAPLIRRSFRNWFQGRYQHMFAKFRCVYAS